MLIKVQHKVSITTAGKCSCNRLRPSYVQSKLVRLNTTLFLEICCNFSTFLDEIIYWCNVCVVNSRSALTKLIIFSG